MSRKFAVTLMGGAMLLVSANVHSASAAELKIGGSAAVNVAIMLPHRAAIEAETGLTLDVSAGGDPSGVKDLFAGKIDAAMTSSPIKVIEASINKANPGSVSVDGFEVAQVGVVTVKFIVNTANPVKDLTEAQLRDIFIGKITSWKDVGGDDQPILVVAGNPGFGTRSTIIAAMLGGVDITDQARTVPYLAQVVKAVSETPFAIGYGNDDTIKEGVKVVSGTTVKQVLGLATKGPPNDDVKKLIASMAKYGASVN